MDKVEELRRQINQESVNYLTAVTTSKDILLAHQIKDRINKLQKELNSCFNDSVYQEC